MDLSEQIVAALRGRNAAGETYEEMAKLSGVSGAQIHRLANHRASPLRMSLETFLSLFPSARIEVAPARVPDDPAADPGLAHELELLKIERVVLDYHS